MVLVFVKLNSGFLTSNLFGGKNVEKKPIQLLIVEDEQPMIDMFRQHLALEREPIDTVYCGSLSEAQEEVARQKPDISVLDLHLPDEQGLTTFKRFSQFADGLIVIVCSGFLDVITKKALLDLGAVAVIDKPFDWATLIALIRTKASVGISQLEQAIKKKKEAT